MSKNSIKETICWAVFNTIFTGQDKVTTEVCDWFKIKRYGSEKGASSVWSFWNYFVHLLKGGVKQVYVVPSRSTIGSLRDTIAGFTARVFGARLVVHVHGNDLELLAQGGIIRWSTRFLMKIAYRNAIFIILSEHQANQVAAIAEGATHFVCKNPLTFRPTSVRRGSRRKLVFASTVSLEKGIEFFLEFEKKYNQEFEKIEVWGQLANNINRVDLKNSCSEKCTLMGRYTDSDLDQIFDDQTVLLFPSSYTTEAQPLVIGEALSRGSFVLSSDIGFVREAYSKFENVFVSDLETLNQVQLTKLLSAWRPKEGPVKAQGTTKDFFLNMSAALS